MRTILIIIALAVILGAGLYYRQTIADRITGRNTVATTSQLSAQSVAGSVESSPEVISATATPVAAVATATPKAVAAASIAQITPSASNLPQTGPEMALIPAFAGVVGVGIAIARTRSGQSKKNGSSLHIL